jgi:hypothetical protein
MEAPGVFARHSADAGPGGWSTIYAAQMLCAGSSLRQPARGLHMEATLAVLAMSTQDGMWIKWGVFRA